MTSLEKQNVQFKARSDEHLRSGYSKTEVHPIGYWVKICFIPPSLFFIGNSLGYVLVNLHFKPGLAF